MTGPMEAVLGRKTEPVMRSTLHGTPAPFHIATGNVRLHATAWISTYPLVIAARSKASVFEKPTWMPTWKNKQR